ncbi:MAG: SPOR domain-containing protein [Cytophagales bacterium]|nr:SPOR domain-containing protein [Bernardetiaceae bacterium]MDW8204540.1 SPOR domain-containing protein [Cytophagales bacterium]
MKQFFIGTCLACCLIVASCHVYAQTRKFAIQLGVFQKPNTNRFEKLQDLGTLLQDPHPSGFTRIRLGDYPRRVMADSILRIVRQRGFTDAFVFQVEQPDWSAENILAATGKTTLYTIQVGVYIDRNSLPNPAALKHLGTLYELQEEGFIKLRLGTFTTRDSAEAVLKVIRDYGYVRAFVTETNPTVMNRDLRALADRTGEEALQAASTYKRMKGKINNQYPVVAQVYLSSQSVSGYYNDPETGQHKYFHYHGGLENPITTFASNNRQLPQTFHLHFRDKQSGKNISLSLSESYDNGSAKWEIISLYRKKVKDYQGNQIGSDIYVEYPYTRDLPSKIAEQRINAALSQIKGYTDPSSIGNLAERLLAANMRLVETIYPQYNWISETYETKILENDRHIFSVRMLYERINNQTENKLLFRSWDMRTGQELTLSNQLLPGYEKALRTLLRKRIGEQYAHLRPTITDLNASVEEMLTRYYFTATGISFFREHKPWSAIEGNITFSIPYKDIAQWLRDKSLASP